MADAERERITLVSCSHEREAALRATMPNKVAVDGVDEILIVLDGSTDGSQQYLNELARMDARIKVHWQERAGIQAARNSAASRALGKWILYVDDDDLVPSDFAATLLSTAATTEREHRGCAMVQRHLTNSR